jgi:hypothetical protein
MCESVGNDVEGRFPWSGGTVFSPRCCRETASSGPVRGVSRAGGSRFLSRESKRTPGTSGGSAVTTQHCRKSRVEPASIAGTVCRAECDHCREVAIAVRGETIFSGWNDPAPRPISSAHVWHQMCTPLRCE